MKNPTPNASVLHTHMYKHNVESSSSSSVILSVYSVLVTALTISSLPLWVFFSYLSLLLIGCSHNAPGQLAVKKKRRKHYPTDWILAVIAIYSVNVFMCHDVRAA